MSAPGWPAQLRDGPVGLRPLRLRDGAAWVDLRLRNERWLLRWEATPPGSGDLRLTWADRQTLGVYSAMVRSLRRQARQGLTMPFGITYEGRLCGQLTVSTVVRGALNSAHVGYWVDEAVAGRGVMPTALAMAVDHCFGPGRLHRVEANVRPENAPSRRVCEKLGFRDEGLRRRFLAIDGAYRDHVSFALTIEDVPGGLQRRWHATQAGFVAPELPDHRHVSE